SQRHHGVIRREDEIREEAAIHNLYPSDLRQGRLCLGERTVIRLVFAEVVREVCALMLDIESRLADGVEPDHQFSQARRSRHEDDFIVGQPVHFRTACGVNNSRNRSGEILSWPILSALPASSWKANAMSCSGFMLVLASAWRIFASALPSAFIVLDTP